MKTIHVTHIHGFTEDIDTRLAELQRGKTMTITLDEHMSNVITYIADMCAASPAQIIVEAITEYYADEIRELEREEE